MYGFCCPNSGWNSGWYGGGCNQDSNSWIWIIIIVFIILFLFRNSSDCNNRCN